MSGREQVFHAASYTTLGIAEIEAAVADFNAHSIFWWVKKSDLPPDYTDYVYITNAAANGVRVRQRLRIVHLIVAGTVVPSNVTHEGYA